MHACPAALLSPCKRQGRQYDSLGCAPAQGTQGSVRDCLFNANVADFGGAVFRGSTTGDIAGCVFVSNRASKIGGAVYDSHVQVRAYPIAELHPLTYEDNLRSAPMCYSWVWRMSASASCWTGFPKMGGGKVCTQWDGVLPVVLKKRPFQAPNSKQAWHVSAVIGPACQMCTARLE